MNDVRGMKEILETLNSPSEIISQPFVLPRYTFSIPTHELIP